LQPVGGQLEPWQAVAAGMNLNLPLQVVSTDVHAGALPSQDSWLRVEPEEVVLAATKWAEDGDGLILRLQSTEQAELTAKIDLIALGGKLKSASACDLLERPDPTTPVEWDGRTVRVSLRPLQLASVRLRLAD
ncbi:MAG: glycosyl hydrolase-related protein, partial [Planctomycetota bacterium]